MVVVVAVLAGRSAEAQRGHQYRQQTPTLSPYLNLYRTDSGAVDNYNNFVRPEIDLRDTLRNQQDAIQRQDVTQQQQGTALQRYQRNARGRQGRAFGVGPTGSAATFMNYMHYYPVHGPPRNRR